jgi:hypothetical protein
MEKLALNVIQKVKFKSMFENVISQTGIQLKF